jgi:hypothetical protein
VVLSPLASGEQGGHGTIEQKRSRADRSGATAERVLQPACRVHLYQPGCTPGTTQWKEGRMATTSFQQSIVQTREREVAGFVAFTFASGVFFVILWWTPFWALRRVLRIPSVGSAILRRWRL